MDKAGITVSAAHSQMIASTISAPTANGIFSGIWGSGASGSSSVVETDRYAAIANKCQVLADKGFEPIANVFSIDW